MGWYYVETPERNRPIEAVLKQCQRLHADRLVVGDGLLMAADDREDAELIVADLTNARQPEIGSQTP